MLPARFFVTAASASTPWLRHLRRLASVAISVVFVVLTLARVDVSLIGVAARYRAGRYRRIRD